MARKKKVNPLALATNLSCAGVSQPPCARLSNGVSGLGSAKMIPVSSLSSRTTHERRGHAAFSLERKASLCMQLLRGMPASSAPKSPGSTAPPGKTYLSGMNAAPLPRRPTRIRGSVSRSRKRTTLAASRISSTSFNSPVSLMHTDLTLPPVRRDRRSL